MKTIKLSKLYRGGSGSPDHPIAKGFFSEPLKLAKLATFIRLIDASL
jgi:hypothetical protein